MRDYGFKVVYAEPKFLAEAGFAALAYRPFILDSEPGYARLPNQFLIDRGLGYWDPKWRGDKRNPIPPSRISMKNFAWALANALEWADTRSIDLMGADYVSDLIGRYQEEMLKGIWSADNRPLAPETVNARVQTALEFQMWAADKGLREPFVIPTTTTTYISGSHDNSRSHEAKVVQSRKGKVKVNKRTLSFPSVEEIEAWRKRVHERPVVGKTEGLIVDLILNTAIRREEAACWRVDTLPLDPRDWKIANPDQPEEVQSVIVTIKYGVKGKEYGIDKHGDKIGPAGEIHVPVWIARRIHAYRNKERLLALKPLLKKGKSVQVQRQIMQQAVHLLLNPITGLRYTGDQIYAFWSRVEGPAHWSPHHGRDWWACRYLEERMKQHAELIQQVLKTPNVSREHPLVLALKDSAQTVIQMEIRPQLRHVSSRTTEIYLQWLFAKMRVPLSMTRQWVEAGEEDGEGDEE
jgi:integrase